MSLSSQTILDFAKLQTPERHGQVLVHPEPRAWIQAARENHESLGGSDARLLGSPLADWRTKVRQRVIGRDDTLVFVTGHGPEWIHPGVWAKHIAAVRAARATGGVALNLVVDSDAPKRTSLPVPSVASDHVVLRFVPFAAASAGLTFEQMARLDRHQVEQFARGVRRAMGERFDVSQMPAFFEALAEAPEARDWVDQIVAARRGVEAAFGIQLNDRRVSHIWGGPLLLDMLVSAARFAASYNRALRGYRRAYRVRGAQRPIPDLDCGDNQVELPVWVYRAGEPRGRLFVSRSGETLRLYADRTSLGSVRMAQLDSHDDLKTVLTERGGWRLRPRALALTLWARLLLADLFIHGIGGAKYDRISDAIIADYYGVAPPHMACVTATLHLKLPCPGTTPESVRRLRHARRDLEYNPQRNLPPGGDLEALVRQRAELVRQTRDLRQNHPRDRRARHAVFSGIRAANAAMLAARPEALAAKELELTRAVQDLRELQIARGREYFFGLHDRARLEELLAALPAERSFRI